MTMLGKVLVMINLVISLMMAAVGMGLYTANIDRPDKVPASDTPAVAQRKALLKEATEGIPAVEAGWRDANEVVMQREERRQADQKWYTEELIHVRLKATEDAPARDVKIDDKTGVPEMDKTGRPVREAAVDRAKKPLQSIAAYEGLLKKAQAENETHVKALQKEFEADTAKTAELTPAKGEKGGLRDRIAAERVKQIGIDEETRSVQHLATIAAVEMAMVGERIEALDGQIESLRRTLSRLKKVDAAKTPR